VLRRLALLATLALLLLGAPAGRAADALPKPTGKVLLTVSGAIDRTNAPGKAQFDLAMLQALGLDRATTTTNWTDGKQVFEGVLARKVLDAVGAHGTTVAAAAIDDYSVDIPIADFRDYPVLLALTMNGTAMTAKDKGPIWIVYPRDDYAALHDPKMDLRWVWQLKALVVK
jgi:hypothetical protein